MIDEKKNKQNENMLNESQATQDGITLNKSFIAKFFGVLAILLQIISCFIPIYTITFLGMKKDVLYIEGDGIIVCICAVVALIFMLLSQQIASTIPSIISCGVFIYTITSLSEVSEFLGSYGPGMWLLVLGYIFSLIGVVLAIVWKTDKYSKKNVAISIGIVILSIVGVIAIMYLSEGKKQNDHYQSACENMKNGLYSEAIKEFDSLGDYKDTQEKKIECYYLLAKEEMGFSDYDSAIELLEKVKDYKDATMLIDECNFNLLKDDYYGVEDMPDLIDGILEKCPNYKKAKDYINNLIAKELEYYANEEEYQEALDFLDTISGKWNVEKEKKKFREKQEVAEKTEEDMEIEQNDEYIIPGSDCIYLLFDDIADLSVEELRIARNEIYARHGYIFKDESLNNYFLSKSWYEPRYTIDEWNENWLNEIEKDNIQFLKGTEETMRENEQYN